MMTARRTWSRIALVASLALHAGAAEFFVAPGGNDRNPGTRARPFASPERARDALREARDAAGVPVPGVVRFAPGTYRIERTLELDGRDSGTPDAPVVFRAEEPGTARFSGGVTIPPARFRPVADPAAAERLVPEAREHVLVCSLADLGIADPGTIDRAGLNGGPMVELFSQGRALPLSRWPNEGWALYGNVPDPGSRPRWNEKPERPGTIEYVGDRPERWLKAPRILLHGYWAFDWYDDVLTVAAIDTESRRITFTTPHQYGVQPKRRFAALNLLEELDRPGEWCLDAESGSLYLWPPEGFGEPGPVLSVLAEPVVRLTACRSVVLQGIVIEYGRGRGVEIRGGTDNRLSECTLRNLGTDAVHIGPAETLPGEPPPDPADEIRAGRRNGVAGCDVYNVGTSGITLIGGDRPTLTPGEHYACNNDIRRFARRKRTNCPGIAIEGVGARVTHNHVHDAPHMGIRYGGNDHLMEFNEADNLCWETGDVGVFYSGRDWTYRGNVVRHNFIHHIDAPGQVGSMAVYLDDSHSSTAIVGNVFYRTDYAAFIGGGRDNLVENNVFIDCRNAVHLDNRSQGWANKYQVPGGDHRMYGKLQDVAHDRPPFSTRYPELARILDENPHEPRGNRVLRNVCVRGNWLHLYKGAEAIVEIRDNWVTTDDPGFTDAARGDFSLKPDAPAFRHVPGFQPIPFAEIGLKVDEDRPKLPLKTPVFIPDGGVFRDRVTVTIAANRDDADIRFTTDGTEPAANSPRYTEPLILDRDAILKAVAFHAADLEAIPTGIAETRFTKIELGEGKGVFVSDMTPLEAEAHGGLKRDTNYRGNDFITLGAVPCEKGLLMHPELIGNGRSEARAVYELGAILRDATRLKARIGIDDAGDERGSAAFRVDIFRNGTWENRYESPVLRGGPAGERPLIDVDIRGAERIRLTVDGGNDISADHAAWGDVRLE